MGGGDLRPLFGLAVGHNLTRKLHRRPWFALGSTACNLNDIVVAVPPWGFIDGYVLGEMVAVVSKNATYEVPLEVGQGSTNYAMPLGGEHSKYRDPHELSPRGDMDEAGPSSDGVRRGNRAGSAYNEPDDGGNNSSA